MGETTTRFLSVTPRTEIDWAIKRGQSVVWAPSKLVLDAVDGYVARRTATVSAFGARFDMETDAFLILVLSACVAGQWGWWVLVLGLARYLFVAAGWALPWLRGTPDRKSVV